MWEATTVRWQVLGCSCVCHLNCGPHIDQLTKTMRITGTPGPELLSKITSEEVGNHGDWVVMATSCSVYCTAILDITREVYTVI